MFDSPFIYTDGVVAPEPTVELTQNNRQVIEKAKEIDLAQDGGSVYDQLVAHAKKMGIVVHNKAEMDAFLKEHGIDDIGSIKNLPEIWLYLNNRSGNLLTLSPKDNAKIQKIRKNLTALAEKYHGKTDRKGVITDFANAVGAKGEGASKYVTIKMPNGAAVVIRISNHNADASTFIEREHPEDNVSIVFKPKGIGNRFRADDDVELTEYVYTSKAIAKDGNLLSSVAESLAEMMRTGEYVDKSGKAIVNKSPASTIQAFWMSFDEGATVFAATALMNGNSDGLSSVGDVTYGSSKNPRIGIIVVKRKGDVLTFTIDNERSYGINLTSDDWVFSKPNMVGNVDRAVGIQENFANSN